MTTLFVVALVGCVGAPDETSTSQATRCQTCDVGDDDAWDAASSQYVVDYADSMGTPLYITAQCKKTYADTRWVKTCWVTIEANGQWLTAFCDFSVEGGQTSTIPERCGVF